MSQPVISVQNLIVEFVTHAARSGRSMASRSTSTRAKFSASSANRVPGNPSPHRDHRVDRAAGPHRRGQILLNGERIDNLGPEAMRKVRGRKIA